MKNKYSLFALLTAMLSSQIYANEKIGRLLSKGDDCGVVDVKEAYLAEAGGQKRLYIRTTVENRSYDKTIYVQNAVTQSTEKANWGTAWWQYPVSAQFESESDRRNTILLRDWRVGPGNDYTINLYVQMTGEQFSCSSIHIGE